MFAPRCTSFLFVFCLLLGAPARAQEATRPTATLEQIRETLSDDWYGVYIQGKKSGYAHMASTASGDPSDPTFTSTMRMEFKLVAMGNKQHMVMTESAVFDGRPPYALRSATSMSKQGAQAQEITATRKGSEFTLVIASAGTSQTLTRPALDYTVADAAATPLWFQKPRKAGDVLVQRAFSLGDWKLKTSTTKVVEVQNKLIDGVKSRLYAVHLKDEKQDLGPGLCDARGTLLNAKLMNLFELRREPKDLAQKTEYSGDLFATGMVKVSQALGSPKDIKRLELKLEGEAQASFKAASFQTVKVNGASTTLVVDLAGKPATATAKEIAASLAETAEYPITHPLVVALAKKAVGDAATPAQKVEALVHFVAEYVKDEYGKNAVSVLDVIKAKRGDCTEHSVLLTALSRALKIPCRTVGGLMYMGDEFKAFGGHAWNEVVLDGKWIPVDPTWDEPRINAAHVRLDGEESSELIRVMGRIRFTVVSVKR